MLGRVSSRAADNLSCHDASKNERYPISLDSRNLQVQEYCDMFYGLCEVCMVLSCAGCMREV